MKNYQSIFCADNSLVKFRARIKELVTDNFQLYLIQNQRGITNQIIVIADDEHHGDLYDCIWDFILEDLESSDEIPECEIRVNSSQVSFQEYLPMEILESLNVPGPDRHEEEGDDYTTEMERWGLSQRDEYLSNEERVQRATDDEMYREFMEHELGGAGDVY